MTVTRSYCKVLQALLQEKNDATFWWQYFKFIACFFVLLLPAEPIYSESNLQIISQLMKC